MKIKEENRWRKTEVAMGELLVIKFSSIDFNKLYRQVELKGKEEEIQTKQGRGGNKRVERTLELI